MKKIFIILVLSNLVGQDYTLPSNKCRFFLDDMMRIEQLGTDAEIVKKEINKLLNSLRAETAITLSYIEIKEAETERVITSSTMSNRNKDILFQATLDDPDMTQVEYQYLKHSLSQVTYGTREISPREEIKKNKTIVQNRIVATKDAEWSNVIKYYGGYAEATEAGISKNDLNRFTIKVKLKNIELISPNECYANISLEGDKNYAFKFHNISKSYYKYRGTYQIDEIDAIDIYNMTMPEIVFSFDEKEYLNKIQFKVPLEKALDKPVDIQRYRTTIIQIFDDYISDYEYSQLDEIIELKMKIEERKLRDVALEPLRKEGKKIIKSDFRKPKHGGTSMNEHHFYLGGTRWHKSCGFKSVSQAQRCSGADYFDKLPSEEVEAELIAMKNHIRAQKEELAFSPAILCGCGLIILAITLLFT